LPCLVKVVFRAMPSESGIIVIGYELKFISK